MDFHTMLDDVYTHLGSKETDLLVLPNPELDKGTTRVIWKNAKAFLKITHTPPDHLLDFIIQTTGKKINWYSDSISDGLILHDKKINNIDVINIMKKYVDEFVICKTCKKSNTTMFRDIDLRKYMVKCNDCNSQYCI